MVKNILITGGAGFIGSNLALSLIGLGYDITVLDNLSKQIHGENPEKDSPLYLSIKNKVKFINGSVTRREDWTEAIKDNEVIVHFAAETGTGQSMYEIQKYTEVNIGGTALMLELLANSNHKVKKVIVASSRSIYGEGKYHSAIYGEVFPGHRLESDMIKGDFRVKYKDDSNLKLMATDENSKIHPSSVYGITKQNQEQMVMTVCPSINISPVAFRYQNVYGPGQSLSNPYTGILSIFSTQIKNNSKINIFEDGKESRDFVYITDVVDATILGIQNDNSNGKVYNVGFGKAISVEKVAKTLVDKYRSSVDISISGGFRLGDIRHNYADMLKIETDLGFKAKVNFEKGIEEFINWVNCQEIKEDKYDQSIKEMKQKGLFKERLYK